MTVRWKLTLSYGGFLVVAGAALVSLLFYILRFVPEGNFSDGGAYIPDRSDLIAALWPRAWEVLGLLVIVGVIGGWFLAGAILRPLRRISVVTRAVAAGSLTARVRLTGADDEFRELAASFDEMLDRLERTFDEQRQFTANASHELRTPYAIERALIDVALSDPGGQDLTQLLSRLDATNRRGTEAIEALLTLSRLDQGQVPESLPIDMAELVSEVLERLRPLAETAGVSVVGGLGEGDIDGSPALVRQLVTNLVLNGIRHNSVGGSVSVSILAAHDGFVTLTVKNSGPVVPQSLVPRLTEPFVRGEGRVAAVDGSGLGLAIVARVASAHGAELLIEALDSGGLRVRVRFPAPQA